ncbi:MAG: hypothetical protein K9J42_15745 [Sulfuritalea sp.]|nr:hypothetical protein [Sulfuritalea sp.]
MKSCVQLTSENVSGQSKSRQVLVNNCGVRVYAFWCHVGGGPYPCKGAKHFRQGRHFSSGERYSNSYTLPKDVSIDFGACSGMFTRIKYGDNGSYDCPVEGPSLEGKGPTHSRAKCTDGRKVDFDWQLMNENEKGAAVKLKDGAVFVPLAEYRAFEKKPDGQPPRVLVDRLCNSDASDSSSSGGSLINDLKGWTRKKAGEMEKKAHDDCALTGNVGEDCKRFRNPPKPVKGGAGVLG